MKQARQGACKYVDIGGQAVMEGVMMKAPDAIAVSVRRPDGTIVTKRSPYQPLSKKHPWMGWPFVRGVVNFVTMLTMGMSVLQQSTDMLGILDEEPSKFEKWLSKKLGKGIDKIVMGVAVVLAVVLSIGLFFVIPEIFARLLKNVITSPSSNWLINLLSGLLRILILIGYILFCTMVPDVRRTFQYHGAEHKTVYCHEHNLPLTPENARGFSTLHPRCGTSFLLIVFVLSIVLFTLVGYQGTNFLWRLLSRLALLPVVAGVSYELLKGLAHHDNLLTQALRWPGMQLQRLTTKPPTDEMLEVAIVSMNVALHGLPKDCPKTTEGFTVVQDYRLADPSYTPPQPETGEPQPA
ncbi:MAG TPA: DUF1385 domain-containing protein [Candidatus Limiplasma stercoravium]|nr:DUF1385 domain-containing protein [Candidatus Limiplasma stercoravium]